MSIEQERIEELELEAHIQRLENLRLRRLLSRLGAPQPATPPCTPQRRNRLTGVNRPAAVWPEAREDQTPWLRPGYVQPAFVEQPDPARRVRTEPAVMPTVTHDPLDRFAWLELPEQTGVNA